MAKKRAATNHKSPRFNERYTVNGYRQAIRYGIKKARKHKLSVPMWTPGQLRHTIATAIAQKIDQQTAQRWLGHKNLATTDIYIEKQVAELIAIARELDRRWAG